MPTIIDTDAPRVTALDIIRGAMRLIGAIATGETPDAAETRDGLQALNGLLETWSIERLAVYTRQEQSFSTVAGQQDYRLGPAGDWDGARPVSITGAVAHLDGLDRDLELLSLTRWDEIERKDHQADPCALTYLPDYPQGLVRLWPVPQRVVQITLASDMQLSAISGAAQVLVLPPGYERALRFNLALELAPEFGAEPPAAVVATAASSRRAIKRANQPDVPELQVEPRRLRGLDAFLAGDC